jgi:transposase InsO family protein
MFPMRLEKWDVKPRFGAVGKHGSIAVTERVIKTLKYEWLKRVPIIRGFDHLGQLCNEFSEWHNGWRPHMHLGGVRPDDVYYGRELKKPGRDDKKIPPNIETRFFPETRTTGYKIKEAA